MSHAMLQRGRTCTCCPLFGHCPVIPRMWERDAACPEGKWPSAMPPLLTRARHLAESAGRSVAQVAVGRSLLVPPAEYERRRALCGQCVEWLPAAYGGLGGCARCGCTSGKLKLAAEACPIETWGVFTPAAG